jgi:hypothetical protein
MNKKTRRMRGIKRDTTGYPGFIFITIAVFVLITGIYSSYILYRESFISEDNFENTASFYNVNPRANPEGELCASNMNCENNVLLKFCDTDENSPKFADCVECLTYQDCIEQGKNSCNNNPDSIKYRTCE